MTREELIEKMGDAIWDAINCDEVESICPASQAYHAIKEAGFSVVPNDPTHEMLIAATDRKDDDVQNTHGLYEGVYKAMTKEGAL